MKLWKDVILRLGALLLSDIVSLDVALVADVFGAYRTRPCRSSVLSQRIRLRKYKKG